jgi:2-octaprenyl-6-methoxyphenol hydroxylase
MAETRSERVDVAVAGAGIVGLAVALAVKRGTEAETRVLLCDAALAAAPRRSYRALAVAAGNRRWLERLGVWQEIAAAAQPMTAMDLTDTRPGTAPPPVFLDFAGEAAAGEPFAHMVFHDDLRSALLGACRRTGVTLEPRGIAGFAAGAAAVLLDPSGPDETRARLLVAADGGRSRLREQAGIPSLQHDYGQTAIVATLALERDHGGRATQHFLPGGPVAVLPMRADDGSGRRASIVWTETSAEANRLLSLPDEHFLRILRERIGNRYGRLDLEDRPSGHALRLNLARSLIAPRLALVGDAARTIHPLAGQGLNLGLRDAEALAMVVAEALDLGLDPGAPGVLAAYQRKRRADAAAMAATTDMLNRLFSNDSGPLRLLRDLGLGLVDRSPGLKRRLIREAAGTPEPSRPERSRRSGG